MQASIVSVLFCAFVLAQLTTRFFLASRQIRHVSKHRSTVPPQFQGAVTLAAHQKAADYTVAKQRLSLVQHAVGSALLIVWTLLGGLDALNQVVRDATADAGPLAYQLTLIAAFSLIGSVLDWPLEWIHTFRLEQRFGFNRMTLGLWLADQLKGLLVGAVIGLPLLALVLWIMDATGPQWWLWGWGAWMAFNLLFMVIYPTWIAPLFNRFEPLKDEQLQTRVQALMARCGFQAQGFYVMDGSRRSAHANAYFTGLGRAKRVVFYDTLLQRLSTEEVEAVLAHELGHFHHRHVIKRLLTLAALSLAGLGLLGWLSTQAGFYVGLGVTPNLDQPNHALALLLFMLAMPPFTYFLGPWMAGASRRHEFQADAYACQQAEGSQLISALVKLHEDNASTLTPDPLFVRFHYSHPPASERMAAIALQPTRGAAVMAA